MNTIRSLLVVLGLVSAGRAEVPATQPVNDRAPIGARLLEAARASAGDDPALRHAASTAAQALPDHSRVREQLLTLAKGEISIETLEQIAGDLAFAPKMEAPTPTGWPALTPVGEVELKSYPKYRMAYVDRGETLKGGEFFTLFFHIQRNEIAMTAPVEMGMTDHPRPGMKRMAFLYQNTDIGAVGKDQKVTVVDVEPMQAVSVGVRGNYGGSVMKAARAAIEAWLDQHPEYAAAGDLRVMGYNSPSVPAENRYAEIQIPVRRR
jgi:hypothetical protein